MGSSSSSPRGAGGSGSSSSRSSGSSGSGSSVLALAAAAALVGSAGASSSGSSGPGRSSGSSSSKNSAPRSGSSGSGGSVLALAAAAALVGSAGASSSGSSGPGRSGRSGPGSSGSSGPGRSGSSGPGSSGRSGPGSSGSSGSGGSGSGGSSIAASTASAVLASLRFSHSVKRIIRGVHEQDPEPTWVEEIMRKLQHFTIEADGVQRLLTEDEKREFAIILGDEEEFYNHFFGPGSADADAMVDELKELSDIAGAVDDNAPTEAELRMAARRFNELRDRAAQGAGEMPISLLLVEGNEMISNRLGRFVAKVIGAEFGVLHAAVDVGGTVLEWGIAPCTSLVIPHFRPQTVLAHVELKRMSLWERLMHPLQAMADFGRYLWSMLMALMSLGVAKQADLRAIARICTKYNRGREYDAFLRNCQHFAGDLLESVKRGEMEAFLARLKAGVASAMEFAGEEIETCAQVDAIAERRGVRDVDDDMFHWDSLALLTYHNIMETRARMQPDNGAWKPERDMDVFWRRLSMTTHKRLFNHRYCDAT